MQMTNGAADRGRSLPAPLRVAADMPSRWNDVELDFDSAADRIVRAHEKDGEHRDLPIVDLNACSAHRDHRVRTIVITAFAAS